MRKRRETMSHEKISVLTFEFTHYSHIVYKEFHSCLHVVFKISCVIK